MKEKREQGSPSGLRVNRTPKRLLTAKVRDQPEEKGQRDAEKKTSDDGKVKRSVFAAVNDVAGQFSQAQRQLVSKIEKHTNQDEEPSEEDKRAAEFAEGVHEVILPEGTSKSFSQPCYYYHMLDLQLLRRGL